MTGLITAFLTMFFYVPPAHLPVPDPGFPPPPDPGYTCPVGSPCF